VSPVARRFDHAEAQCRYDAGESLADLAVEYGVTRNGLWQVVTPEGRRAARRSTENRRARTVGQGVCDDCGGTMNAYSRKLGSTRCRFCAARAQATSVRESTLRCKTCREWKQDAEFPHGRRRIARRGRHQQCRACQTKARQDYRERHKLPCVGCGAPALPPSEKRTRGGDVPRCRECFYEDQRARRRGGAEAGSEAA